MKYQTRKEVLEALGKAPKGAEREKILSVKENRDLLLSSGANVTLYTGEAVESASMEKMFANVYVGLIQRLNAKTGKPDGVGALGGLSERTDEQEFYNMSLEQRKQLIGQKDDVIRTPTGVALTTDINIIRLNNVLRETAEELGNLGIYDYKLNKDNMELVDMPEVKDDNFAVNIWNGKGNVWCITPYCHVLKTDEKMLDTLSKNSENAANHEQNSEAAQFSKIKLFDALKSFGNFSGTDKLEDGRNAKSDYRYPHEWLASWALAAKLLNYDNDKVLKLYQEVQRKTSWKISFKSAAQKMGKDLSFVAQTLKIDTKTVEAMEKFLPPTAVKNFSKIY